jgi:hypothetical protein
MKAFFNDEKIKQKYLKRVEQHRLADELIQGVTWEDGKGCRVERREERRVQNVR